MAPLRTQALISNRALARVGLLSYSLYLVHEPIVHFSVGSMMNGGGVPQSNLALRTAVIGAVFALCIAVSAATYRSRARNPHDLRRNAR